MSFQGNICYHFILISSTFANVYAMLLLQNYVSTTALWLPLHLDERLDRPNPVCHFREGFIQDFSTGGGGSISATVQPPTLHEVGGGNYASTDLIGPVGSGGLPIMHCAPNILSKIVIDVQNPPLCDLLQGRIQDHFEF